jgi:hypothetical protein
MTEFIDRPESRYLDILHIGIQAILSLKSPNGRYDKYEDGKLIEKSLLRLGAEQYDFGRNQSDLQLELSEYGQLQERKPSRTLTDSLLALDIAKEVTKVEFLKSQRVNNFNDLILIAHALSTSRAPLFYKSESIQNLQGLDFLSRQWVENLRTRILSYGYFARFLDTLKIVKNQISNDNRTIISYGYQKNLMGPFDKSVKSSGPDFVQDTFMTWAFFFDVINIHTNSLKTYDLNRKINYLRDHRGYTGQDGNDSYLILKSLKSFSYSINYEIPNEIRICSFYRFASASLLQSAANNGLIRKNTVGECLIRLRLLYLLNSNEESSYNYLNDDKIVNEIRREFGLTDNNLIWNILYLESMGLSYEVSLKNEDSTISSLTEYVLNYFLKNQPDFKERLKIVTKHSPFFQLKNELINNLPQPVLFRKKRSFNTSTFEESLPSGNLFRRIINID